MAGDSTEPFFETLLREAVGSYFLDLDDGHTIVVEVPAAADVGDLDATVSVLDLLDLVAGEGCADAILARYERRPHSDLVDVVDDIREHFGILHRPVYGWAALVEEINRYGPAIERDMFAMPGPESLYDWVRDHPNMPWDRLFRLLSALPDGGWYHTALADDDDRAARILEMEQSGELPAPSKRPPLLGWTRDRELATEMVEAIEQVWHGVWGASPKFKGKGGRPPQRRARPETARDRAEQQLALVEHDDIASQLLGSRYQRKHAPPGR